MSESVAEHITLFAKKYLAAYQQEKDALPMIDHDESWPSPCEQGEPNVHGEIAWQAVPRKDKVDLSNLNDALDIKVHPSLSEFYCTLFSAGLGAEFEGEQLQLLQAWNEDDYEQLQQNLVGHVMMKKKLKQRITCFIAVTDDDNFIISVLNITGEVVLEPVGKEPSRILASSLSEFLERLKPVV